MTLEEIIGEPIPTPKYMKKCYGCDQILPVHKFYPKSGKTETAMMPSDHREGCKDCYLETNGKSSKFRFKAK